MYASSYQRRVSHNVYKPKGSVAPRHIHTKDFAHGSQTMGWRGGEDDGGF